MNIHPICFIDVSLMAANLLLRHKAEIKDGSLLLRDGEDRPILATYKSAKVVLGRISKALAVNNKPAEIVRAAIEVLPAGEARSWSISTGEYAEEHNRLHVCLVPAPGAWLYSGGEGAVIPVGQLVLFNHRTLHSEINLGASDRIHLVIDARIPEGSA